MIEEKPRDEVLNLGAGENPIKQADNVAHAENLARMNKGEPLSTPMEERAAARKKSDAEFAREHAVEDLPPPKEDEGVELSLVNLAKLFLRDDDKMTDYAQELRDRGGCDAKNPEVTIKVPGDRDVQLLWRGKSGISVKPVG